MTEQKEEHANHHDPSERANTKGGKESGGVRIAPTGPVHLLRLSQNATQVLNQARGQPDLNGLLFVHVTKETLDTHHK